LCSREPNEHNHNDYWRTNMDGVQYTAEAKCVRINREDWLEASCKGVEYSAYNIKAMAAEVCVI